MTARIIADVLRRTLRRLKSLAANTIPYLPI